MVRVEKILKEKDYKKVNQVPNPTSKNSSLNGLLDDLNIVITGMQQFPIRNSLAIIGAAALLYIGFKISRKFGSIRSNLEKV